MAKSTNTPLRLERLAEKLHHLAKQRRLDETGGVEVVRENGYVLIPLLHGVFTKIDASDEPKARKQFWTKSKYGYAISKENGRNIWLHRIITKCPLGMEVDHINGDRLDNRKMNLRLCTKREQQGNRWKSKHAKTSIFKGVYFCKRDRIFAAYGREGHKSKRLGTFKDEVSAALAYDEWARKYFGDFAKLNMDVSRL